MLSLPGLCQMREAGGMSERMVQGFDTGVQMPTPVCD